MRANNGVPAVHVTAAIEKMHGTAQPARTTGFLAEKLRHARIRAGAAGERMCVIAIRRDDVIVVPHGRDGAGDDRFLSNVKMAEAAYLLRLILLARAFLETADQQHQREHLDLVAWLGPLHRKFTRREAMRLVRGSERRCGRSSCKRRRAA